MDIFLPPVSNRVMFRGLRKLKPRRLCLEPPSASNSEPRFLGDPFIKPLRIIHMPVHPPTAFPNHSGEYRKRETQNHRSEEASPLLPQCDPADPVLVTVRSRLVKLNKLSKRCLGPRGCIKSESEEKLLMTEKDSYSAMYLRNNPCRARG
ncbi:hypothetical protein ATANTOWER_021817 [Ataeniobius toweri]|uniref:Uncharacterized protein n=1 Tax=Ataeniobius toweri TaxID=208326 RepID=A0ABU7BED8_9TELE|nr:hypothetical protein [Ataeniobius toweri]